MLRPRGVACSRTWRVGVEALAHPREQPGEHGDFLGRDGVEEEAADDVALDQGGLVEEGLACLRQEDEASAPVALAGAALDEAAGFEAPSSCG